MSRDEKIIFITKVIGTGFLIAIIYHLFMRYYLKLSYPYDTFLFRPNDNFMDFIWPYRVALDPYLVSRADSHYFPFMYAIMRVFRLVNEEKIALVIYLLFFILAFIFLLYKYLFFKTRKISSLILSVFVLFSYPLIFSVQRANLEFVVFAFVILFLWLYRKNNQFYIFMLACAIATKIFPAIFLVLLFWDKRYKEIVITLVISAILTLISLVILPGDLLSNVSHLLINLSLCTKIYSVGNEGLFFGNSLWGAMKYLIGAFAPQVKIEYGLLLKPYLIFALGAFTFIFLFISKHKISFESKLLLLICAMDLLPYVSADYKLIYFYIPLLAFISKEEPKKYDKLFALFLGLLFVPKNYFNLPQLPEANISLLVNPFIMIMLCVIVLLLNKDKIPVNAEIPLN
jgi:hypothetical protein